MLAGGNRVLIKPSEFTPETSKVMKKSQLPLSRLRTSSTTDGFVLACAVVNSVFPTDLVEVVIGGVELGVEFSKLRVRFVSLRLLSTLRTNSFNASSTIIYSTQDPQMLGN